jgi:hypothetical protein
MPTAHSSSSHPVDQLEPAVADVEEGALDGCCVSGLDHTGKSEGDVNLHPRLVEALSKVPYSALYGILWPTIVEQASFETRLQLREVNDYFENLCHPYRRSDRAKSVCRILPFLQFHWLTKVVASPTCHIMEISNKEKMSRSFLN